MLHLLLLVLIKEFIISSSIGMDCYSDQEFTSYDTTATWDPIEYYFFNGMESYYSDSKNDRNFAMTYCASEDAVNNGRNIFRNNAQFLPWTRYDDYWSRGCGGSSALFYAKSEHDNGPDDRIFYFQCNGLNNNYILDVDSCQWDGYYPQNFKGNFNYKCNIDGTSGIIRTIESYHDNGPEDRKYKFECCLMIEDPYKNYPTMITHWPGFYSNEWDGVHPWAEREGNFLIGLNTYHNNYHEDRRFQWKFGKPLDENDDIIAYTSTDFLEKTIYDSTWEKSCIEKGWLNGGIIGAYSVHDNYHDDREWTFKCGLLDDKYSLVNCGWTGYLNNYDDFFEFICPNNGIIRGIYSIHSNNHEDRIFKFDCCNIIEQNYDFTNKYGYWDQITSCETGSCKLTHKLVTGTTITTSQTLTESFSNSLSSSISSGFTMKSSYSESKMEFQVTETFATTTSQTISESYSYTETEWTEISCSEGIKFLYQFVIETDQAIVKTKSYLCTNIGPNNIESPICAPGYFDCTGPDCNTCTPEFTALYQ